MPNERFFQSFQRADHDRLTHLTRLPFPFPFPFPSALGGRQRIAHEKRAVGDANHLKSHGRGGA